MKRIIAFLSILAIFALPSVASAHSGHVTCDSTGIVYHYDANFPANTLVTEHVNGVNSTFTPPAFLASTHTISAANFTAPIIASATWVGGGSILPTTIICPTPPVVPPVTPPVVPPTPPVVPPTPPVIPPTPPAPPVIPPVPPTPPVTPPAVCLPGYKLHQSAHVNYCLKNLIKIKVKIVTKIKYVWWCPRPPKKTPGVTG